MTDEAQLELVEVQASICTSDENCQAEADQHEPDCPVEARLLEEFKF